MLINASPCSGFACIRVHWRLTTTSPIISGFSVSSEPATGAGQSRGAGLIMHTTRDDWGLIGAAAALLTLARFFADLASAPSAEFYQSVARFGAAFVELEKAYLSMQS